MSPSYAVAVAAILFLSCLLVGGATKGFSHRVLSAPGRNPGLVSTNTIRGRYDYLIKHPILAGAAGE
jgi:hypothetical protein